MDSRPDVPLGELSTIEARLSEVATRLADMGDGVDATGREDLAVEVREIERLVESAARRARRLLRQQRPR
ncbi:MAG: hypothetical protein RIE08_00520 [Acidimicrobiales bacterium]